MVETSNLSSLLLSLLLLAVVLLLFGDFFLAGARGILRPAASRLEKNRWAAAYVAVPEPAWGPDWRMKVRKEVGETMRFS